MSTRKNAHAQSVQVAFCGLMAAFGTVIMLLGGILAIATYVAPMIAGIILISVLLEYGKKSAWTVWLATLILTMVLCADKEAAFFYLFFGCYPLIKTGFDRIHPKFLNMLSKLAYFILASGIMYAFLCFVLHLDAITGEFAEMGISMTILFFAMLLVCLMLYDRMLPILAKVYAYKLRPKLPFLPRR